MKIAHMSDLHYCQGYLAEADRCFGFAVDDAIARNVDVAIISGDSTHHAMDAHAPSLLALAKRVKKLADHCPVLMLQGTFSHEPPGTLQMLSLIGAKHPIAIADKIGMIGLSFANEWYAFDGSDIPADLRLAVTCVPTVNKADLVSTYGAENASIELGNQLAALLASFGPTNDTLRAAGVPTVLVSHGTVDGSLNESGVPMAGLDHEFTLGSLYSAKTSATMLGHIHKQQTWERSFQGVEQKIAYAGSAGRFHYGEIGDKYYLLWHLQANAVEIEPVVTPSRMMIDIDFTGVPDLDELASVAKDCAGAYVRVRYQVDAEHAKTVDRAAIRQILAGAEEIKIEGTVLPVQRQRAAGISRIQSLPARFERWCEITETPKDGLIDRLALLDIHSPEEIVKQFSSDLEQFLTKPQLNLGKAA